MTIDQRHTNYISDRNRTRQSIVQRYDNTTQQLTCTTQTHRALQAPPTYFTIRTPRGRKTINGIHYFRHPRHILHTSPDPIPTTSSSPLPDSREGMILCRPIEVFLSRPVRKGTNRFRYKSSFPPSAGFLYLREVIEPWKKAIPFITGG